MKLSKLQLHPYLLNKINKLHPYVCWLADKQTYTVNHFCYFIVHIISLHTIFFLISAPIQFLLNKYLELMCICLLYHVTRSIHVYQLLQHCYGATAPLHAILTRAMIFYVFSIRPPLFCYSASAPSG